MPIRSRHGGAHWESWHLRGGSQRTRTWGCFKRTKPKPTKQTKTPRRKSFHQDLDHMHGDLKPGWDGSIHGGREEKDRGQGESIRGGKWGWEDRKNPLQCLSLPLMNSRIRTRKRTIVWGPLGSRRGNMAEESEGQKDVGEPPSLRIILNLFPLFFCVGFCLF